MGVAELVLMIILISVLGRAVQRGVAAGRGRGGADPQLERRVAEVEAEIDRLRGQEGRVEELEERLDFAERLLSQLRAGGRPPQVPGR